MSKRPRRNHTPVFKAKVALAAMKGEKTLACPHCAASLESMGGGLETMACFPDQRHVRLRGFGELNESGRTVEMSRSAIFRFINECPPEQCCACSAIRRLSYGKPMGRPSKRARCASCSRWLSSKLARSCSATSVGRPSTRSFATSWNCRATQALPWRTWRQTISSSVSFSDTSCPVAFEEATSPGWFPGKAKPSLYVTKPRGWEYVLMPSSA